MQEEFIYETNNFLKMANKFQIKVTGKTSQYKTRIIPEILLILLLLVPSAITYGFINDLRSNGFSLIPAPQKAVLTGQKITLNDGWSIETRL
ncbi:MAG: hypothetical protein DRI73_11195, partial [Bacteroidetes bacterium]